MTRASFMTGAFWSNPVVVRDLRVRLRGSRAFWNQGIYLGLLILLALVAYISASRYSGGSPVDIQRKLQQFYTEIFEAIATLVTLIAPALTAISIISEKQRQTLDLLVTTPMTAMQMLTGKLASSIAFLILLLFLSVPASALCVVLGGATIEDVLRTYALLIIDGVVMASIGLAFSCMAKQNIQAIAGSYAAIALLMFVTAASGTSFFAMVAMRGGATPAVPLVGAIAMLNPFVAVAVPSAPVLAFGLRVPIVIATALAGFIAVRLILTSAALRLGMYRGGLVASLRRQVLVIIFFGSYILGSATNSVFSGAGPTYKAATLIPQFALSIFLMSSFFLPALFVPVTDEDLDPPQQVRGAYNWRQMFTGEHSGALPYFHLWLILMLTGLLIGLWPTPSPASFTVVTGSTLSTAPAFNWPQALWAAAISLLYISGLGFIYWCFSRRAASLTNTFAAARPVAFLMFVFALLAPMAVQLTLNAIHNSDGFTDKTPLLYIWLLRPLLSGDLLVKMHWEAYAIATALAYAGGLIIYPPWMSVSRRIPSEAKRGKAEAA